MFKKKGKEGILNFKKNRIFLIDRVWMLWICFIINRFIVYLQIMIIIKFKQHLWLKNSQLSDNDHWWYYFHFLILQALKVYSLHSLRRCDRWWYICLIWLYLKEGSLFSVEIHWKFIRNQTVLWGGYAWLIKFLMSWSLVSRKLDHDLKRWNLQW
jgi:hypothetical protein